MVHRDNNSIAAASKQGDALALMLTAVKAATFFFFACSNDALGGNYLQF